MIEEELDGACEYVKSALKYKDTHPSLSKTFYDISTEEVKHINMLHEEVTAIISEYRKEHGEPPDAMLAVYDYLHEKHIDKLNRIKTYQMQYRGS